MNDVLQQKLLGKLNQRRGDGRSVDCASEGHEIHKTYQQQNLKAQSTVET